MTARFLLTLGLQMQAVVIGWIMYELTRDALFLGLIGLVEAIPALSLALYAGYLVDRSEPLLVYRRVIEVSLLSAVILLVTQMPAVGLDAHRQVIALFVSSFMTGLARGFSQPAVYATVPRLVSRQELSRSSAWMTSSLQVARISGPGLGGLFYGWLGAVVTSSVVCAILIGGIVSLLLIRSTVPAPPRKIQKENLKDELLSGARFVFRHPILFPALTLDMISVLFGGVTALLPIYAADILHAGPKGLGLLRAAPAVGAVFTSYWMTRVKSTENAGRQLFLSIAGFGITILVFSISHNYILSLIMLCLSGAFDSVSMVIRTAAVQLASPDHMRGRISAVNSIFIGSSNELGEFESGIAARFMGTVPAAVFGSIVCLLTVAVAAVVAPALRNLNLQKLETEAQKPL